MPGTRDNEAARGEDQVSAERGDMGPKGGKGPTAAAMADQQGAFGDAEGRAEGRDPSSSSTGDSLSGGPMVFDNVGEKKD